LDEGGTKVNKPLLAALLIALAVGLILLAFAPVLGISLLAFIALALVMAWGGPISGRGGFEWTDDRRERLRRGIGRRRS
jgi:hypothetical protein